MHFLDSNANVLEWSSESLAIPYINPFTGRWSRYFPDFVIKYKDNKGVEKFEIIEVKPMKQTIAPTVSRGKSKKTVLTENKTWIVNNAKWASTVEFCKKHGYAFRIITENDLFFK